MTLHIHLLGFDARDVSEQQEERWGTVRKETWLLKPDVEIPFSVDAQVWSSPTAFRECGLGDAWRGSIQDLWENLSQLEGCVRASHMDAVAFREVAIGLIQTKAADDAWERWSSRIRPTVPSDVAPEWKLLGYDVADEYLLSGLSNCIHYAHSDYLQLQSRFSGALNLHHLFVDLDTACEFAEVANERVPEHAPFFVFGLWWIVEVKEEVKRE